MASRDTHPDDSNVNDLRISTAMNWEDAVFSADTLEQLTRLRSLLETGESGLQTGESSGQTGDDQQTGKPGLVTLFCGPAGTGKTLAATLLGKQLNKEVYRIDLSEVTSKYIGETEKNLEALFTRAESAGAILLLDEADALFGKRTDVKDANDKYANIETNYLLQRIENYNGLVILTSNMKENIDDAFVRRLNMVVQFPMPDEYDRRKLWQRALPSEMEIDESVDLEDLANKYELSGAGISKAARYAAERAAAKHERLQTSDILEGIRKEYIEKAT